ncbi:PPOX class F420-dependent oxidoreductase [Rhodococcoides corynebacterioides]|uniref:PPOX class F420-dependent oxidoreductase n=1 Tax=Rhodococcoides corynebacterioides TaxID=53972 RepID=A0ABS7P4D6_9NOCA|nr:PPOX class F420-dependent oxidoreductase [Rhodococcus corynebacterioides]MBY6367175.1 PPOX class F420-dependent oxidoreductase [Rhodococcus corynebacterioides]MBY6407411.1 PPOX class F420-dependent oxidoreductase [Rhodococcus corynebacterioides]
MARKYATAERVDLETLHRFVAERHRATLVTHRRSGGLQISPVTCGLDDAGRIVISTYPQRAKTVNIRHTSRVTLCVHSDDWDGPYVQIDGTAEVLDLPDSVEPLVDYYRSIAGEHPDWDEYREAMRTQGKSILRISIDTWGPVATGGFPAPTEES